MEKYEDIINTNWHGSSIRAKMTLNERAKIFLPFAALKGFEQAIEERRQRFESKIEAQNHAAVDDLE